MAKPISDYLTPQVIVNLAVVVGFLIFIGWVLIFLGSEINDRAISISEQRAEIHVRTTSLADLASLREEAKRAQPAYTELSALLPKKDDLVSLPRYLEEIATGESLSFTFHFSGVEREFTSSQAGSSAFTINLVGGYQNIVDFVRKAETGRYVMGLDTVDIFVAKTTFGATINGVVYYSG